MSAKETLRAITEVGIVPVVRDASRWVGTSVVGEPRDADIEDAAALSLALQDATTVVSCAHARHAAADNRYCFCQILY